VRKNRVSTSEPPRFEQYKNQGNASNLVQSHFGSPASKWLESGIAPLVPRGFYPANWGLNQPSPSPVKPQTRTYMIFSECHELISAIIELSRTRTGRSRTHLRMSVTPSGCCAKFDCCEYVYVYTYT